MKKMFWFKSIEEKFYDKRLTFMPNFKRISESMYPVINPPISNIDSTN